MASEFKVEVAVNGNELIADRKEILIKKNTTFIKFKKEAAKKLNLKQCKVVYSENGAEVNNIDEISANSLLYISQGEPFFRSSGNDKSAAAAALLETYSVSVLGTGGVGKSAITLRFVRDFFAKDWDPTIEDAYKKTVDVDSKPCKLEILDTAGQDEFESLRSQWMAEKDGLVFVYSLDNEASLNHLTPFIDLHLQMRGTKNIPVVLAANKKDKVEGDARKLASARERGQEKAREIGAIYIETSAATGEGVTDVFESLVRNVRKSKPAPPKQGGGRGCVIC